MDTKRLGRVKDIIESLYLDMASRHMESCESDIETVTVLDDLDALKGSLDDLIHKQENHEPVYSNNVIKFKARQ